MLRTTARAYVATFKRKIKLGKKFSLTKKIIRLQHRLKKKNASELTTYRLFYNLFADSNDHGELHGTNRSVPEVLLFPEVCALLGSTGTSTGRRSRGRRGQHAFRCGAHQGTDEELHQHVSDRTGRVRSVLSAVRVDYIVRKLHMDLGRRLLLILEVVSVRTLAHRCC